MLQRSQQRNQVKTERGKGKLDQRPIVESEKETARQHSTLKLLSRQQQTTTQLTENTNCKLLTEAKAIHKRGNQLNTCGIILKAIRMLKNGKPADVDNTLTESLKQGGPGVINAVTVVCQTIWTSGQWPKNWTVTDYSSSE